MKNANLAIILGFIFKKYSYNKVKLVLQVGLINVKVAVLMITEH